MALHNSGHDKNGLLLQYNLRVARTEGAGAASRAEEASTSHDSIKQQYIEAQTEAQAAAASATAEIGCLQVGTHLLAPGYSAML